MPRLIQLNGSSARKQLVPQTPTTKIGRAETIDVTLDNERASRFRAAAFTHGEAVAITDLNKSHTSDKSHASDRSETRFT
ncbi:MAG: hypothetical protein H7340_07985 [Variovorax sp.]|nr:hypothetical protein [Variovorax sp.]